MRWRRRHTGRDERERRAEQALQETRERAEDTRQRDARARRLAETIRAMRERNHLAEAVEAALRRGR